MADFKQPISSVESDPIVTDSPAKKLAAAVLGVIVVFVFLVLLISGIRFIKGVVDRAQTKAPITFSTPDSNQVSDTNGSAPSENSNNSNIVYTKTPKTGPRENAIIGFIVVSIVGYGLVVVSKKVF